MTTGRDTTFYLDGVPTHAYMKMLYRVLQVAYPYDRLVLENQPTPRSAAKPEYELADALGKAGQERKVAISTSSWSTPRPARRISSAG